MTAEAPSPVAPIGRKRLAADTFWAMLGTAGSTLASLALVKVVARLCDVSGYGQASLVLGVVSLAQGIVLSPLAMSHLRLLYTYQARGIEAEFERAFVGLQRSASGICTGIYVAVASLMAIRGQWFYLACTPLAAALLFLQPHFSRLLNHEEAARRQRRLNLANLGNQLAVLGGTALLLVVARRWSTAAVLGGQVVAIVISVSWIGRSSRATALAGSASIANEFRAEIRKAVFAYGWSFPLAWFSSWIMSTSDRYFLEFLLSPAAVGAYAVNYALWSKPFLLMNGTLDTLTRPLIYRSSAGGQGPSTRKVVLVRMGISALGCLFMVCVVYFLHGPISGLLLTPAFRMPRATIIWIAVAYSFYVVGHCLTPVLLGRSKAHLWLAASVVAAIVSTAGNLLLIPKWGALGAALAGTASYVVFAIAMFAAVRVLVGGRVEPSASPAPEATS